MKNRLLVLLILIPFVSFPQNERNSWEGSGMKPNTKMRLLNIFINVIYDKNPYRNNDFLDTTYWGPVSNPLYEGVNVVNTIPKFLLDFIDTAYNTNNLHGTITRLYGESSFDSLQLTGDFVVVNVRESRVIADPTSAESPFHYTKIVKVAIDIINENGGLNTIYGHNNITDYLVDENNNLLYPQIIIRNITKNYGKINPGSGYCNKPLNQVLINGNYYGGTKATIQCVGHVNFAINPTGIVPHEISHLLFGDNKFHTSGGNHRQKNQSAMSFPNIQGGYGLMGAAGSSLVGCNGYERWRMHWKHPDAPCYISAQNPQNTSSIPSDISREDGNKSFYLRDFVTYGDEIRIRLPYKDSEDASNQYIWLENHQVGHNGKLDFLQYSNEYDCRPQGQPGIYAYYQIGRDVLSGSSSTVWFAAERDNLKIIPAEGYWDYVKASDSYNMGCVSYDNKIYSFHRNTENPFCGSQDQEYQFFPPANANQLYISHEYSMWRKYIGNTPIDSLPSIGDNRDAFSTPRKINMSTNPSTCNAKTFYATNDSDSGEITGCDSIRNTQTTYLTGLSIEMIPNNLDFLVNIRWDDYDITNDARWTGKVVLKDTAILNSGHTITLAQNRTVAQTTRDPQTGLFAKRSQFICEAGSYFRQEQNTVMQLTESSSMHLDNGCTYIIGNNSELRVGNGCTLTVNQTADLQLQGYARIVVDSGGVVNVYDSVKLGNEAYIVIRPGGKLVVDGGTLTSVCQDGMWAGIYVEGHNDQRQLVSKQGVLELKNGAVIEHAHNAVNTCDTSNNTNSSGGIIMATNTIFRNNKRSLQFISYENTGPNGSATNNASYFDRCKFVVNDDNHFAANNCISQNQVSLWEVRGVNFIGCTFHDSVSVVDPYVNKCAIYSLDAGIKVQEYCPFNVLLDCKCETGSVNSSFYGYGRAILANNSGTSRNIVVRSTNFVKTGYGIIINADNNARLFYNNFNLSQYYGQNPISVGIYLYQSTNYTVEENTFNKSHHNSPNSYGIAVYNGGPYNNSLYKNQISDIRQGIYIGGNNGSVSDNTGLQCTCNDFRYCENSVIIDGSSTTINPNQGNINCGADNDFTGTYYNDFYSLSNQIFNYYYSSSTNHIPYNSTCLTGHSSAASNSCASTLCNSFIITPIFYAGLQNSYDSLMRIYESNHYEEVLAEADRLVYDPKIIKEANSVRLKMAELNWQMYLGSRNAVHAIIGDTSVNYELLEEWYRLMPDLFAKYALSEIQFEQGKVDESENTLSDIEKILSNDAEYAEYDYYKDFFSLKKSLVKHVKENAVTTDWPSASGAQITELQRIAESSKGRTSSMARSVLCFFFDICYDDVELDVPDMQNPGVKALKAEDASDDAGLTIWPNPTSGKVSVLVSGENTIRRIELYDVFGHMLVSRDTEGFSCELDLSSYTAGNYILAITLSDGSKEVRKVVKN